MGKNLLNRDIKPYPQPLNTIIGDQQFKLYADFSYLWEKYGIYYRITVPKDTEYDGASIPWYCWSLVRLTPTGKISAASCVHDYIYTNGGSLGLSYCKLMGDDWLAVHAVWTKDEADKLFAVMLREAGVGKMRRRLAYLAVKYFGRGSF